MLLRTGTRRKDAYMLDSQPIMPFGFRISRQRISPISSQFCVMRNLRGIRSSLDQVEGDGGGALFLAAFVGV